MPRLTANVINNARPRVAMYDLYDQSLPGFMLRIMPSGRKTFSLLYKVRGGASARQRLTLGAFPVYTAETARAGEGRSPP